MFAFNYNISIHIIFNSVYINTMHIYITDIENGKDVILFRTYIYNWNKFSSVWIQVKIYFKRKSWYIFFAHDIIFRWTSLSVYWIWRNTNILCVSANLVSIVQYSISNISSDKPTSFFSYCQLSSIYGRPLACQLQATVTNNLFSIGSATFDYWTRFCWHCSSLPR